MRIGLKHVAGLVVLAVLGGFGVGWSGLVSVAASSGHTAPVGWFLHFVMIRSVEVQSAGIPVPALDDPAQAALGAAHFAGGCAPCHGAPGEPQSSLALAMTPPPPWLEPLIPTWEPEELFWIVQHGIKYSGMPAWATQARPDEVWNVVAFLGRLPGMDAGTYRALALGPEAARVVPAGEGGLGDLAQGPLEPLLAGCARCHGRDGAGREEGGVPLIGGQNEPYLAASLAAYADGRRASGIMQPLASSLRPEELDALARHYAGQAWPASRAPAAPPDTVARGAEIASAGVPAAGVPACASCHGPRARYPHYPEIAGQDAGYLARQLELFRDGSRGGTAFAHIMPGFARRLTDADIEAVAAYYAQARTQAAAARP